MNHAPPRTPGKIAIAGNIGSGKSSVARRVVEITGWPLVSTGSLFRELAARRGLTVLELNQLAESDPTIDAEVDGNLIRLAATDQAAVIDSRLAWHFVPQSFKVYLVVDPKAAVGRVYGAGRADERYSSVEEATAEVLARQAVEAERYHDTYGVTVDDWRNYDLIVDTSRVGVDTVAEVVIAHLDEHPPAESPKPTCHFDPARLMASPDTVGAPTIDPIVRVAVHDDQIAVVSGHELVATALDRDDRLIRCELIAFEDEEVDPGVSAIQFVSAITAGRDMDEQ
ncbi:MAG: cytidylate kinase family protein [Acidimicrobiia bacterium]